MGALCMKSLNKLPKYLHSDFIAELKLLMFPALLFGLIISMPIHPLRQDNIAAESFNRVFGSGALGGIDPNRRTNNLLLFNVFLLPLCFFVSFVFAKLISKISVLKESDELREFVNAVSIAGIGGFAFAVIAKYSFDSVEAVGLYTPIIAGLTVGLILFSTKVFDKMDYSVLKWSILLSFAIALLLNFMFQTNTGGQSLSSKYKIFLLFPIVTVCVLAIISRVRLSIDRVRQASVPLFFGMFAIGLWLEFTNMLNQHGIFIVDRLGTAKIISFVIPVVCVFVYIINRKPSGKWELACCIGLILGITYFISVPPLTITATIETFEQANHGMLVYDTVHYDKIPLLESFDGHMLKWSFRGLLYSWLNGTGSIDGSYFFYHSCFSSIINVFMFLLMRKIFKKEFALFAVLFVPLFYIDFYILALLTFFYAINHRTILSWIIYFASLALIAFYELPPAVAVGGGTALISVAYILSSVLRERKVGEDTRKFLIAALSFFGGFYVMVVIMCAIKGINPVSRAREFLGLISSNNTWAYMSIGDRNSMLFSLLYSLIPIIAITALILSIYKYCSIKSKEVDNSRLTAILTVISLLLAYFLNFHRALGRHSLAEEGNGVFYGSMFFFVAFLFFGAVFIPKFKKQFFICVSIVFPLIINGIMSRTTYNPQSLLQSSLVTYNNPMVYYDGMEEKVVRVNYNNVLSAHASVIKMLNTVIAPDETYMDLSSETMFYALTGKEKPVYINQSTLHLSGEYTQVTFVNQVEKYGEKCAYALIGGWMGLDGVDNPLRIYKVYEYLIENFRPLCYETVENFSLWVRKDRYAEVYSRFYDNIQWGDVTISPSHYTDGNWENGLLRWDNATLLFENRPDLQYADSFFVRGTDISVRIENVELMGKYQRVRFADSESAAICANADTLIFQAPIVEFPPIDYSHYNHNYYAGYIPFLWGEYDKKKAYKNEVIREFASPIGLIPINEQSRENYLLFQISSAQEDIAHIYLFDDTENLLTEFNFTVKEGTYRYIVRPSSDSYWRQGDLFVRWSTDAESEFKYAALLMGD